MHDKINGLVACSRSCMCVGARLCALVYVCVCPCMCVFVVWQSIFDMRLSSHYGVKGWAMDHHGND